MNKKLNNTIHDEQAKEDACKTLNFKRYEREFKNV